MKISKTFLLAGLLCVPTMLSAQEEQEENFKFSDHTLLFSAIEREWHDQNLFTITSSEQLDIQGLFLSFAQAYPSTPLNLMVAKMLGYEMDGIIGNYVLDAKNGYISGEVLTELTCIMQMCFWHTADNGILVGIALQGDEYTEERVCENVDDDCGSATICVNDLMFFKIEKGEAIWRPRTPLALCGEAFDFSEYHIQLPRSGKDIKLTHRTDERKSATLQWNGNSFQVHYK